MSENKNGFFGDFGDLGGFGDLDLGSDNGFVDLGAEDDALAADIFNAEPASAAETTDTEETAAEQPKEAQPGSTETTKEENNAENAETESNAPVSKAGVPDNTQPADLFEAAVAKAEEKQAADTKSKLIDKLPIFSYANASEEIADTSKTFDQLRNEKAEDFPELDDGTSVSWKMVYGTVTKTVSTTKKTTIASMKKEIENSKAFLNGLKKAKGEIECKVTPTVTAKKKGVMPAYKGVYSSLSKAVESGKPITFIPSGDGDVFEVRNNRIGTFIAKAESISILGKVKSGFIPALPKIPYELLEQITAFFKSFVNANKELEALVYIYWSFAENEYKVCVPEQMVSKMSVDTTLPDIEDDDHILVMEVHSHNTMPAIFSSTDDKDEKATRLYTVIGRLDKVYPDISTRISVGGKYVDIAPSLVFESITGCYPKQWADAVSTADTRIEEDAE